MKFIFVFGSSPQLSLMELRCVLSNPSIELITLRELSGALVDLDESQIKTVYEKLGGTVKVIKLDLEIDSLDTSKLADYLLQTPTVKISFGVVGLNDIKTESYDLAHYLKKEVQQRDVKARFVLPQSGSQLSSVVITKQKVVELAIYAENDKFWVGKTIWVQDFASWSHRDYDRPAASGHLGMLPPKVARMMLNLSQAPKGANILDPFCGVGTVLAEGLVLGYRTFGSDLDVSQVEKSRLNLDWLINEYPGYYSLRQCDARKVSPGFSEKIAAIVTEPDLGPNDLRAVVSPIIKNKLTQLYVSCLTDWKNLLAPNGVVVITLPKFVEDDSIVQAVIDKAEAMGYSLQGSPTDYFRPEAKVRRSITIFKLGK